MKKISFNEVLKENFLKDYSFLIEEDWMGDNSIYVSDGRLNLSVEEAVEFLYMFEAKSNKELSSKIQKFTSDHQRLYMRYNLSKNSGRCKKFPILPSDGLKKSARLTKPAVIKLFIFV